MEKDCKMIFSGETPDYEFSSKDLATALKWAKEKDIPVTAIKTPWSTLSILDEETYDTAMKVFEE